MKENLGDLLQVGQGLNARFLPRPKHASHFAWPKYKDLLEWIKENGVTMQELDEIGSVCA